MIVKSGPMLLDFGRMPLNKEKILVGGRNWYSSMVLHAFICSGSAIHWLIYETSSVRNNFISS